MAEDFLQDLFLEEIKLRAIAEETGFVDGEIFEKQRKLGAAFAAGEQAVVRVERIELANLQAALQAVFEEMRAALIKKHAALLVDKRLEQLEFGFGELNLSCDRAHIACWGKKKRRQRGQALP